MSQTKSAAPIVVLGDGVAGLGAYSTGLSIRHLPASLSGRGRILLKHPEDHRTHRIGWLRAAVLGANDGIVSTASLIVGVAAAETGRSSVLVAGMAGLVAGAMSMAAGEYVGQLAVRHRKRRPRAGAPRARHRLRKTSMPSWPASMSSAGSTRRSPRRWPGN